VELHYYEPISTHLLNRELYLGKYKRGIDSANVNLIEYDHKKNRCFFLSTIPVYYYLKVSNIISNYSIYFAYL